MGALEPGFDGKDWREVMQAHKCLDDGKCLAHTGGIIRPKRGDEVGFRRFLAPIFAFIVETGHDRISRAEVHQDSGQRLVEGKVTAVVFKPCLVRSQPLDRVGYAVQFKGRFDKLFQPRFDGY